ncbi:4Fe-4S dicluster domain-containing protein [Novispirillum sp. DQ9]|uniref:4Fe-4S dicluster domain-containing protein n=1 Tax=Novispirillum sp. DQ9 TaxID=3398612 RepID=UPI003C7D3CF5
MKVENKRVLVCSCEGSMPLDAKALGRALGVDEVPVATQLCRGGIDAFLQAAGQETELVVACTQEAPLFREVAEDAQAPAGLSFVNIRETAGWSTEGQRASPKIAALLREATLSITPTAALPVRLDGRLLVVGAGEVAFAAARQLAGRLSVTCVLTDAAGVIPPAVADMALLRGRIVSARGHAGAFTVALADVAMPRPSSRDALRMVDAAAETTLEVDAILDLTGGTPLFPGARPRDGYLRAEPGDLLGVQKAVFEAADLAGEFDKPRFVKVNADLCAHSRSKVIGCTRCLDACPTGAIAPAGTHVDVDALACSGHGACASVCPTGAITYAMPAPDDLFERLRVVLTTYRKAGGATPVLLVHDLGAGAEVIGALARFGRGLPAHVIPFAVHEPTSIGLDFLLTALTMGAARIVLLTAPELAAELGHLHAAAALCDTIAAGLGYEPGRVLIETAGDPDALALVAATPPPEAVPGASYMVRGPRRTTFRMAFEHLHAHAPAPVDVLPLPAGTPFGSVEVNVAGCTLCLACVGACPTAALGDNPDKPQLTFLERDCVQCGLCAATCPEKVITLAPRIDFKGAGTRRVVKEEEPFSCIRCGKDFGAKSTIDKLVAKLSAHSMFAKGPGIQLLQMCEDCRVIAQIEQGSEHFPSSGRRVRTTEDYLRERDDGQKG